MPYIPRLYASIHVDCRSLFPPICTQLRSGGTTRLQVLAALLKRPEKGSKLRSVWEYAHWGVGWMSLAAGLANDASGLVLLQPLSAWYTVGFAALVVAIAGYASTHSTFSCLACGTCCVQRILSKAYVDDALFLHHIPTLYAMTKLIRFHVENAVAYIASVAYCQPALLEDDLCVHTLRACMCIQGIHVHIIFCAYIEGVHHIVLTFDPSWTPL